MKVSYKKTFNWDNEDDPTLYSQTIRMVMDKDSLDLLNIWLKMRADEFKEGEGFRLKYGKNNELEAYHSITKENVSKPLIFGKNYLTLSQFFVLYDAMDWRLEDRIFIERNTILLIEEEKSKKKN